ncbi:hypothetical protein LCGC14_1181070 [marine sediment metagenome]|uniref:KTSC domain-containing protein n=1 Tax=marine sediment metagenome TaxID=412755 RepID=A0A0F9PSL0_9ZZZZ
MTKVDSSNVDAIGYDNNAKELHVRFLTSGEYIYHGVSEEVFQKLEQASSKGRFINQEIKKIYGFTKK